jgi:hypothetical protein
MRIAKLSVVENSLFIVPKMPDEGSDNFFTQMVST